MGTCIQTKQNLQDQNLQCQQYELSLYQRQQDKLKTQVSILPKEITIFHQRKIIDYEWLSFHQSDEQLNDDVYLNCSISTTNYHQKIHQIMQDTNNVFKNEISNQKYFRRIIKELRKLYSSSALSQYILPLIYEESFKEKSYLVSPIISRCNTKVSENFIHDETENVQFILLDYPDRSLLNGMKFQVRYLSLYCQITNNGQIRFLDNLENYDLPKLHQVKLDNMIFYQLNSNGDQNKHLPPGFTDGQICELLMEEKKYRINLQKLKNDFTEGLYLQSYQSLKEHIKRRYLKQYHLWLCLTFDDTIDKSLIACAIFANYLKKQSRQHLLETELVRITQGGTLYFTFDRIKCIVDSELSESETLYLLSNQIVQDVIRIALSNAKILIKCLEQKFNLKVKTRVKQIANIDSHYFTSSAFLKYNSIVEEHQKSKKPLFSEKEFAYSWIAQSNAFSQYELFLPSLYYQDPNQKYFVPKIDSLNNWISYLQQMQADKIIQDAKLLLQIQIPDLMFEEQNYEKIQYQLYDFVLKGYYHENQFSGWQESQRNYELAIRLSRQLFGDCRNRGSILYPLEAFCWHRLSVFASQHGDSEQHNIIKHFFSQFNNIQLPCNNIQNHEYKSKDLNQVLKASLKGFTLHDWLFRRFNELQNEEFETFDPQFIYQPGQIVMWGFNQNYQLGQKHQFKYNLPITLKSNIMFTKISCGYKHTLALCSQGQVFCWGNNEDGKCGKPPVQKYIKYPSLVETSIDCIEIECGHDHSIFINKNYEVYSWGCGEGGLLGNGQLISTHIPQKVQLPGECTLLRCGGLHNAAIIKNCLYVWGRGDAGQLGLPLNLGFEISTPTKVQLDDVVSVACGDAHTVALIKNGDVYGWGYNEQGQLGMDLEITSVVTPTLIFSNATQIYCGSLQSYFVQEDCVYGSGCNDDGQMGLEANKNNQGIQKIFNQHIDQLSIGQDHTLCNTQNKVYGWGMNKFGQLCMQDQTQPKVVFNYKVQSIGCGAYHSGVVIAGTEKYCAYKSDYDYKIIFIQ